MSYEQLILNDLDRDKQRLLTELATLREQKEAWRLRAEAVEASLTVSDLEWARRISKLRQRAEAAAGLPELPCCPVHENLLRTGGVRPFDNCVVCTRNHRDELQAALKRYGRHLALCQAIPGGTCTCGLDKALASG